MLLLSNHKCFPLYQNHVIPLIAESLHHMPSKEISSLLQRVMAICLTLYTLQLESTGEQTTGKNHIYHIVIIVQVCSRSFRVVIVEKQVDLMLPCTRVVTWSCFVSSQNIAFELYHSYVPSNFCYSGAVNTQVLHTIHVSGQGEISYQLIITSTLWVNFMLKK